MLADERRLSNKKAPVIKSLKSNEPFFLDDTSTVLEVQSGTLAIFAVSIHDRTLKGKRRYLFSVKAGEMLFPARVTSIESSCKLLAVSLEATELQVISRDDYGDRLLIDLQRAIAPLEDWLYRLQSALSSLSPSRRPTPIHHHGLLLPGEIYQPTQGKMIWTRLLYGRARLGGMDCLEITPATGWIPLSTSLWCEAISTVELDVGYEEKRLDSTLLTGLDTAQSYVLRGIQQLEQREREHEYQRFHDRERLNADAMTQTLSKFVSVFHPLSSPTAEPEPAMHLTPNEALLAAAGAVGRSLGIAIGSPSASADTRRHQDPLEAIARASQIRIRRVTLRNEWWKKDGGALLTYTLDTHQPVALLPYSETAYQVFNPLQQSRQPCSAAIAATLSPKAYTFYRPLPATIQPLTLLQFALRGRVKELITILIAGVAATLLGMITPQATALLIDQAIPSANHQLLLQITLGLAATVFGTTLFQLVQGIAIMRLETHADSVTQSAVWDRLLKLKASFFHQYSIGDLSSRVSAISQIRQKLGHTIIKSLFSSIFSLLNLGLLFYYSLPLALVATLVAGVNGAVTIGSGVLTLKKVRPLLEQQGTLFGMMVQLIHGVTKFRIAGAESRAFAYWGRHYSHQLKLTLSAQGIEDNLVVINQLLSALTPAVQFAVATALLHDAQISGGDFSTGTFLAFNVAFGTFIGGATSLSTTVIDVLEILPIWQRTQPILYAQPEVDLSQADPGRLAGQLIADRVEFRYRPDGPLTLDAVSIRAEPGEFIALVGPSGSGKSTLLRLILGFDQPESGTLYFDGQDASGLDMTAVRRQLGVVLQNSRLMSASIFENISSNAVISMDEAWEAARMAGLADDITSMPMGMHTIVSEGGTNLSGGQRQRLLIARSLALRPRILLFDEATSALDNHTQVVVSESLDRLKVTRIVVAHRLSTIRNADRIYVLEKGRVVQVGDFQELASEEGLFRQLIQRQQM